ncbi:unnamed protein product [Symbiodinium microadriaticum]|nr:unnamed protein product [Symbiodinium sp. KB8]CAE7586309.1 unnamed protein product [Symbiodinium microadriaticum]
MILSRRTHSANLMPCRCSGPPSRLCGGLALAVWPVCGRCLGLGKRAYTAATHTSGCLVVLLTRWNRLSQALLGCFSLNLFSCLFSSPHLLLVVDSELGIDRFQGFRIQGSRFTPVETLKAP